ncbi:hypothetical protein JAAARDRAFT_193590 [Jaapia argillacea MUCL 33604]|uniref:PIN domain-containing protein n=1 Tax=Jaapia argillacea MUCL 33604 TaxID=933084 RepID=A0A067Q6A1_9AGAM|nr:hypothetical protein JAAARDRAFT_193590 [Jaapia argillacea MUCL 33604]
MNTNKLAMSRALGAAFLNHQVEQLEKSVTNGPASNSNNWRERKQGGHGHPNVDRSVTPSGRGAPAAKRPPYAGGGGKPVKKRGGDGGEREREDVRIKRNAVDGFVGRRDRKEKDADIVVLDASVLVHSIGQVKKWCRDDRDEIVIVPLEALNTLDLLKKGTSTLAQRARAASRILEAQVGTNPRIRVQQDDAFVLWDEITFSDNPVSDDADNLARQGSPEWVRRTICCAKWEAGHAPKPAAVASDKATNQEPKVEPKVVLAVISSTADGQCNTTKVDTSPTLSPVPLPAPHPYTNKFEPRSSGSLVSFWAKKAGIQVFEVKPTPINPNESIPGGPAPVLGLGDDEKFYPTERGERGERGHPRRGGGGGRGRRNSHGGSDRERSGSVGQGSGIGLVERPPAVLAMMEMVGQKAQAGGGGRVVRVLARGEKLDPDTP